MGSLCSSNAEQTTTSHQRSTEAGETEKEQKDHETVVKETLSIIRKGIVKVDHFQNIYRLEPKFEGSPNLRQAEGYYIFGSGQPTVGALKSLLQQFQS